MTTGDLLVVLAMLLLYLRGAQGDAARQQARSSTTCCRSLLFVGMAAEFMLVPQAATPTFFLLTVLAFVDVITGVSVSARPRRSEIVLEGADEAPG